MKFVDINNLNNYLEQFRLCNEWEYTIMMAIIYKMYTTFQVDVQPIYILMPFCWVDKMFYCYILFSTSPDIYALFFYLSPVISLAEDQLITCIMFRSIDAIKF